MEEIKESSSFMGGEVEKVLHQEDRKSLQSEFKKDEEHHMRMKKSTLKLLNIIPRHIILWTSTNRNLLMDV